MMKLKDKIQRPQNAEDVGLLMKGDLLEMNDGRLVHYDPYFADEEIIFLVNRGLLPSDVIKVNKKDIILNKEGKISLRFIIRNSTKNGTYSHTDELYYDEILEE